MNLDFTDPNLLIDDFAFPESPDKHRTQLKTLELPKYLQNDLFLQTGGTEFQNASIQLEGNSITIEAFVLERYPKQAREAFLLANKMKHRHIRYKKDGLTFDEVFEIYRDSPTAKEVLEKRQSISLYLLQVQ